MVESEDNASPEQNQPTTCKKPYQKPGIDWEQKMEPITHALTCALQSGEGVLCDSSPVAQTITEQKLTADYGEAQGRNSSNMLLHRMQ